MTPGELRARLAEPGLFAPDGPGGGAEPRRPRPEPETIRPCAVLVPLVLHDHAPSVLLTRRAAHLSTHPGQVSFPGGRIEPGESVEQAALREAMEEVGLDPRWPEVAGRMAPQHTLSGFVITPVIGLLKPGFTLAPDPSEVALAFEMPLATLLDPAAPRRERAEWKGELREYWVWPHEEEFIWGATAAILVQLARALRG